MASEKTMESQKPGYSPRPRPEVAERERVAQERAAQKVHSWSVQNERSNVLGRIAASAAGRILNSADSREIRT